MSFPNPDNYGRGCECGPDNTTPPPTGIQNELNSLDARVTTLEETNDVIVSSGTISALTTGQQDLIHEGSIVVTTDGKRWVYSGSGSKVLESSYIELSDLTIGSTANLPLITGASGVITAGSFGTTANTFCEGNDSRLSDARTPLPHTHGNISNAGAIGSTANLPLITTTSGVVTTGSFGTTANTFCQGNDVRVDHVRPLGSNNVFVGNTALSSASLSGINNSAVGANALQSNTTGNNNSALGVSALQNNTTGNNNSAFGLNAIANNTTGLSNSAVGVNALFSNTTGSGNSALGANTLLNNSTGTSNSAVGANALRANTTGSSNSAMGDGSLFSNTTGNGNSAMGRIALTSNTTGSNNSAVGTSALQNNTTGFSNSALGINSLLSNTTGNSNSAVGDSALLFNTTGSNNSAFGFSALRNNIGGGSNCAFGINALYNATGDNNSAVGRDAGERITTGIENTLLGSLANVDTGARSRCVVLGYATTSPAVDGSLAVGGTGGNAMGNLVAATAGGSSGQHLRIYLNGTQYKIALLNP